MPAASDDPSSRLDEARGYRFAAFDVLRDLDPGYDDARRALAAHVYTPPSSLLSVKDHEIIAASILCARAYPTAEAHLRRALAEGATMVELAEALQAAAVTGGGPTMHFAAGLLSRIAADRDER